VGYFSQDKSQEKTNGRVNGTGGDAKVKVAPAAAAAGKNAADVVSTLGPGMVITGNIVCEGSAHIFGRVIGDIQAAQVVIGDGAQVEGNVSAHDVAINGTFKGTVRGHNVKLKGAAVVDGEVFSKSLTVEENVQFEGVSRRLDKPVELPSTVPAAPANQVPELPPTNPVYAPVPAAPPEQTAA
jgi:cytoskeletal protein CcmA (bactofilin family)